MMSASGTRGRYLYPLGFFALTLVDTIFHQWTLYFHAPAGAKLSWDVRWVSLALLASNVVQGVSDPFVGVYADNLRTRFGRRRPLILLSAPLLALLCAGLWLRPGPATLAFVPLYGLLFVLVAQPYLAMLPTVAEPGAQRNQISLIGNALGLLAAGGALVGGPIVIERVGYPMFGFLCALSIVLCVFLPMLYIQEPATDLPPPAPGRLWTKLMELLKIASVRSFLLGNVGAVLGTTLLTALAPYVPQAFLGTTPSDLGVLNGALFAGMVLSLVIIAKLAARYVPRRIFGAGALLAALLSVLVALVGPELSRSAWLVLFFLLGFPAILAIAASPLELARLSDVEAKGQEGLLFGLNGLIAPGIGRALAAQIAGGFLHFQGTLGLAGCLRGAFACAGLVFAVAAAILLMSHVRPMAATHAPA